MASSVYHSIVIEAANALGDVTRREGLAAATITPGELLDWDSATTVNAHGVAGGVLVGKMVALESQTPDSETADAINVDYASGDTVYFAEGKPGDVFYMWLAAQETTVANVSQLISDGAGALTVETVDGATLANSIVGVATEVVAAGGARARVKVRIT